MLLVLALLEWCSAAAPRRPGCGWPSDVLMDDMMSHRRACKYGAECWRPGCWFQHGPLEQRNEFAAMYADFWAGFREQRELGPRVLGEVGQELGAAGRACCGQCCGSGQLADGLGVLGSRLEELVGLLVGAGQHGQPASLVSRPQLRGGGRGAAVLSESLAPVEAEERGATGPPADGPDDDVQGQLQQGAEHPHEAEQLSQTAAHGAWQLARKRRSKRQSALKVEPCTGPRAVRGAAIAVTASQLSAVFTDDERSTEGDPADGADATSVVGPEVDGSEQTAGHGATGPHEDGTIDDDQSQLQKGVQLSQGGEQEDRSEAAGTKQAARERGQQAAASSRSSVQEPAVVGDAQAETLTILSACIVLQSWWRMARVMRAMGRWWGRGADGTKLGGQIALSESGEFMGDPPPQSKGRSCYNASPDETVNTKNEQAGNAQSRLLRLLRAGVGACTTLQAWWRMIMVMHAIEHFKTVRDCGEPKRRRNFLNAAVGSGQYARKLPVIHGLFLTLQSSGGGNSCWQTQGGSDETRRHTKGEANSRGKGKKWRRAEG